MNLIKFVFTPLIILLLAGGNAKPLVAQERLPVREYTNPDEMIAFDRSTDFQRALDVINDFAQENVGKIVIDRTGTTGPINISIPAMHWRDALDMILRVKGLQLLEQEEFFEIVEPQADGGQGQAARPGQVQQGDQIATTETREVRINAIFFEGNRRALREIGVDWSTLTESVPDDVGDFGDGTAELPVVSGFNDQFVSVNSRGASNVSQNVFNSLINFGEIGTSGIRVQALFSAFEADNLGEILASPSVKVMDGQEGNIQVGQDFSIKQRDFAGNVTDQFFSVGTILTVTPTIVKQSDTTFIHINVVAERSSAQPDPVSTIVNKQEAETQAILMDGEATAIAGLYRTEAAEVRRGIPILKDLPPWFLGLRYLFGFNSTDYVMRELVILVQAEIEPSIPDRFGKQYASKFQVLNDERNRIRDEIDRQENFSPAKLDEEIAEDDEMEAMNMETESESGADAEPEEQETDQEEEPEQLQEEPEVEQPPVVFDLPRQEIPADQLGNVELPVSPVPLDLGPSESESEQMATDAQSGNGGAGTAPRFDFYIIGASFTSEQNAINFRNNLADEGFDSEILTNPESEFYYVAYRGYDNKVDAKNGLSDIKEYYNNPDAWIYSAR
ncbi:MAG: SPOR domain-containing protein [Balneolaceae bacterium]|nr:SPOR domain-containing protein [Balneolaceae bacterium]